MAELCPDWILSTGSNVHLAASRGWFMTYTPYETHVIPRDGSVVRVVGIGTVIIPILKHKVNKGKRSQGSIKLQHVLHAPGALCNIIGCPFLLESGGNYSFREMNVKRPDGSIIALFDSHPKYPTQPANMPKLYGLPRLKLHHQQGTNFAPSKIKPDGAFAVGVEWPEAEVEKYEEYCNASANSTAPKSALSADDKATKIPVPPYTIAEKEWIKHRSGHKDEFHFLRAYGLSIYDDEDREEGRLIVRGFMAHDTEDGDDDSEEERNAWGHQVDYAFTVEQLNFLEKGWGTAENFLLALRLRSYDVEDLKLGKQILLRLMASRS